MIPLSPRSAFHDRRRYFLLFTDLRSSVSSRPSGPESLSVELYSTSSCSFCVSISGAKSSPSSSPLNAAAALAVLHRHPSVFADTSARSCQRPVSVSAMRWSPSQRPPKNHCKHMKPSFDRRRDAQGFGEEERREVKSGPSIASRRLMFGLDLVFSATGTNSRIRSH
jgi:hypothetical protein